MSTPSEDFISRYSKVQMTFDYVDHSKCKTYVTLFYTNADVGLVCSFKTEANAHWPKTISFKDASKEFWFTYHVTLNYRHSNTQF